MNCIEFDDSSLTCIIFSNANTKEQFLVKTLDNKVKACASFLHLLENPKNATTLHNRFAFYRGKNSQNEKENSTTSEAQEHYDRAKDALVEAIGHSMAAGLAIEVPPVAVYEGYKAIEAWREVGREYCEGARIEEAEKETSNNKDNHD